MSQLVRQLEAEPEKFEIINCYDSHTHFVATGATELGFKLQDLKSAIDIKNKIIHPHYFQGHWLVGFGWNQHDWDIPQLPTKKILDNIFPDFPVLLSRVDGHCSWINSKAIHELSAKGYDFKYDLENHDGILFEQDHINALLRLPVFSDQQIKAQAICAIKKFNHAGFTHVRDLSMNSQTASILSEIYLDHNMTVCIDGFITAENINDLSRAFEDFKKCKEFKNPFLRLQGLKIFVDGSIGSKTAFVSKPYSNIDSAVLDLKKSKAENIKINLGILNWSFEEIKQAIHFCWSNKIEIAVHTIGDAGADLVVDAARSVAASGLLGKIHLEHVQLLRPETINKMKSLHIHCHMQPCHWLSDKKWIKQSIPDLFQYLFQWELLRKNKIAISFGSDSPIEHPSIFSNLKAIKDTEFYGISKLNADPILFYAHPDSKWGNSKTLCIGEEIREVYFNGQKII